MRRSIPYLLVSPVLLVALLAGCVAPAATTAVPRRPGPRVIGTPPPGPAAGGGVGAGIISNHGSGVIPIASGTLVGRVSAPAGIVSNNGGALISDRGGGVVSDQGGAYRLAQAPAQVPLGGFEVRLLDAAGAPVIVDGKPLTATTDAGGRYAFQAALPARNLIVEIGLGADRGMVRAIAPREGGDRRTADVDLVSTLTTGYIMSRYVRPQPDPLATLEKLPADVEATTRARAASAVAAAGTSPARLQDADVVATLDALRREDAALDRQLEVVRQLLVVAGASELGDGLPATAVTIKHVDDLVMTPDGILYILAAEDRRVWRLRQDGILETAVGSRATPDGGDLTGRPGPEAALDQPKALNLDAQGRLIVAEARGALRLDPDGTVRALGAQSGALMAAAAGDEAIVAVIEARQPEAGETPEGVAIDIGPGGKAYVFYRCRAGATPTRLFQLRLDPADNGEQTTFLTGLAWDGADALHVAFRDGAAGGWELQQRSLATQAIVRATTEGLSELVLGGGGQAFYRDGAGALKTRNVLTGSAEAALPGPPSPASPRFALGPDGKAYASQYGVVFRLEAGGPARIAGAGGDLTPSDASVFTFEVLSDCAVAPAGDVYAIDTGKGAVFHVNPQRQIRKLGDTGRGNVQLLRCDPAGNVWMSDGDGTGLGKFDAQGVWTKVYGVAGLINDFAIAADGTAYVASWDFKGDQQRRVERLSGTAKATLYEGAKSLIVALDASGVPHLAGDGALRRWDGAAWQVVKADARFDFGVATGQGMAFDARGRLYLALPTGAEIVRYDPARRSFEGIVGPGGEQAGTDDGITNPRSPGLDGAGNLYFADPDSRQVKRLAAENL